MKILWKQWEFRLLIFSILVSLSGCAVIEKLKPKETKKPGQEQPLNVAAAKTDTATKRADDATTNVQTKQDERASKVLANVQHARNANQDNPEGKPKEIVDGDLQVAESHLSDVKPDPAELAARERDAKLVEAGKASEARANYDKAAKDALALTEQLTTAKAEAAQAVIDRDAARESERLAREAFVQQLDQNKKDNQAAIDKLNQKHQQELDAERQKMFHIITYALIACAIACILIGAFSAYGKVQLGDVLRAATVAAVWAGAAAFCIACAWTINQPWFKWVLIGGLSLGSVGGVMFFWAEYQAAKKGKTRIKEADEAEDALKKVMSVIDQSIPKDDPLIQKLSSKLSDNHKALINELKAEVQRSAAV